MALVDSPVAATANPVENDAPLAAEDSTRGRDLGAFFALAVALVGAGIGAQRLGDNSFLTHLATGREMVDHGMVREDGFTWTSAGEPLVVQSWLASWLYGMVDAAAGFAGLRLLMALTTAVLAALAWKLTERSPAILTRLAVMAPTLYVGLRTWTERPLLIALVLFAATLILVERELSTRWLVLIGAVWISVHGSWPLGLVLLGVRAVGAWLDDDPMAARRDVVAGAWLGLGMLVAGVVNPYGPALLFFPLDLIGKQDTLQLVAEWKSPNFATDWTRAFLLLVLMAILAMARRSTWRLAVPAAVFVAAALMSRRNIPVAVSVLLPAIAHGLPAFGRLHAQRTSGAIRMAVPVMAVMVFAVPILGVQRPHVDVDRYPVAALDELEEANLSPEAVRLVHQDFVGNYLGLRYRSPVAWIDDRFELHSSAIVSDYVTLLEATKGWSEVLDRWQAEVLIWPVDAPLTELVTSVAGWTEFYVDDSWAVLCHPATTGCSAS